MADSGFRTAAEAIAGSAGAIAGSADAIAESSGAIDGSEQVQKQQFNNSSKKTAERTRAE